MASLITCPHCGRRPTQEFSIRSDASLTRPLPEAGADAWHAYVFLRDNPKGRHHEHWHHAGGCRRWLVVERDTVTHEVYGVSDVASGQIAGFTQGGAA
jgi:sarcosine oxidase subunit delta